MQKCQNQENAQDQLPAVFWKFSSLNALNNFKENVYTYIPISEDYWIIIAGIPVLDAI